jgi:hypothetical protein
MDKGSHQDSLLAVIDQTCLDSDYQTLACRAKCSFLTKVKMVSHPDQQDSTSRAKLNPLKIQLRGSSTLRKQLLVGTHKFFQNRQRKTGVLTETGMMGPGFCQQT